VTTLSLTLSPYQASSDATLREVVARELALPLESITSVVVRRRNIDARQRRILVNLSVDVYLDGEQPAVDDFSDLVYPDVSSAPSAVVVGAGPCGLFAALRLIELGVRPIVVERGQDVMQRRRDLVQLEKSGVVDPESNYSFGEGGAGAFSDGKLYTRSKKRGSVEKILRVFCRFGADPKILIDAHPHIGTDKLPIIIRRMREQIIASGGEVHFACRMEELILERGEVRGVVCSGDRAFHGPVLLATGHSARDVYRYLHRADILIEANYSDELLAQAIEEGITRSAMRPRLLQSHMELSTTIQALKAQDLSRVQEIVLLHLSSGHADPDQFQDAVQRATAIPTYIASTGFHLDLHNPQTR